MIVVPSLKATDFRALRSGMVSCNTKLSECVKQVLLRPVGLIRQAVCLVWGIYTNNFGHSKVFTDKLTRRSLCFGERILPSPGSILV